MSFFVYDSKAEAAFSVDAASYSEEFILGHNDVVRAIFFCSAGLSRVDSGTSSAAFLTLFVMISRRSWMASASW